MSDNVLIVGATSSIARQLACRLARRASNLILAGRDVEELARTAADLTLRFDIKVDVEAFDALAFDSHAEFFEECVSRNAAGVSGVVFCVGTLDDRPAAGDFSAAKKMIDVNYTSAVSLLELAADYFQSRRRGWICALSSVAGDRGRQSNYLYGSAKGALSVYLAGLRNRLAPAGIGVITIKPGCVDTAMTFGMKSLPLLASPERVAADIDHGIRRRRSVVYSPWFWQPIMAAIRLIPEPIFQRMKL